MTAAEFTARPWRRLADTARWHGDPLAPVVDETDVEPSELPMLVPRAQRAAGDKGRPDLSSKLVKRWTAS